MKSHKTALFLTIGLWCLYTLTLGKGPRNGDEMVLFFMAESIVERHSLDIPQALEAGYPYGKRARDRRFYAPTEALPAVVSAPLVAAGKGLLPKNASRVMTFYVPGTFAEAATAAAMALTAGLLFLMIDSLGLGTRVAGSASLLFAVATMAWPYSRYLYREPYLSLAIVAALALLLRWRQRADPRALFWAGLAVGAGIWCKREIALALPGIAILALAPARAGAGHEPAVGIPWKSSARALGRFLLGPALAVGLLLAWNLSRFGDPFTLGYPDADETGKALVGFGTPLWVGLYGFLLSPGKSVFLFNPPLLLAIPGLALLWRRDRVLATTLSAIVAVNLLVLSTWNHWEGAWCWGPRHALPWVAVAMPAIACFLVHRPRGAVARVVWRGAIVIVTGLGCGAQVLGVFVSYMTYARHSGAYYKDIATYQITFNPWRAHWEQLLFHLDSIRMGRIPDLDLWQCFFLAEGVSPLLIVGASAALGAGSIVGLLVFWRRASRESVDQIPQ
ncbi:MAG: phospholipid carrier-dependent glycosyltransferase [Candidatus Schekmanbacteria bacterium]|nr:phospholipid carrier-dependent glycosyltransferase [Candidatus Schekmanbacteria bacterium]